MNDDRITFLEERVAYLGAAIDDLSDIVTRQSDQIDRLSRRLGLLLEREAEREAAEGGAVPLADQAPPHW